MVDRDTMYVFDFDCLWLYCGMYTGFVFPFPGCSCDMLCVTPTGKTVTQI